MAESAFAILRRHGLAFPETVEDFPWGHTALKVRGKTFAWLDQTDGALSLTVKLPISRDFALVFDFAAPAGYGLGRSGWISCRFGPGETPDIDLLKGWLAESYRAVAPKKLAASLRDDP
jgi:predicted DNA-binding protein (MmcQ/YjbR family)